MTEPEATEPESATAATEDHSDPWAFASDDEADAPEESGTPPTDEDGDQ